MSMLASKPLKRRCERRQESDEAMWWTGDEYRSHAAVRANEHDANEGDRCEKVCA